MGNRSFRQLDRDAGAFLLLGCAANLAGVLMFTFRGGHLGGVPPSSTYYAWERGSIMAAIGLTAVGFVLLDARLDATDGRVAARAGATAYLFAGVLGVTAEALSLRLPDEQVYPLIAVYVLTAFAAQAAIGGALLRARVLAPWIGWTTLVWNLAWPAVLPLISSRDIYYPVLHHFVPLLIGSALLRAAYARAPLQQSSHHAALPDGQNE